MPNVELLWILVSTVSPFTSSTLILLHINSGLQSLCGNLLEFYFWETIHGELDQHKVLDDDIYKMLKFWPLFERKKGSNLSLDRWNWWIGRQRVFSSDFYKTFGSRYWKQYHNDFSEDGYHRTSTHLMVWRDFDRGVWEFLDKWIKQFVGIFKARQATFFNVFNVIES